ncbi:hypothetical protein HL670_03794 [Serratia plymuthica]|nr:hypothetical protein HL670_03794 [Serratia plymuthica]
MMKKQIMMLAFASLTALASFGAAAETKLVVGASNVPMPRSSSRPNRFWQRKASIW